MQSLYGYALLVKYHNIIIIMTNHEDEITVSRQILTDGEMSVFFKLIAFFVKKKPINCKIADSALFTTDTIYAYFVPCNFFLVNQRIRTAQ